MRFMHKQLIDFAAIFKDMIPFSKRYFEYCILVSWFFNDVPVIASLRMRQEPNKRYARRNCTHTQFCSENNRWQHSLQLRDKHAFA